MQEHELEEFKKRAISNMPSLENDQSGLDLFLSLEYHIKLLNGKGIVGYSIHEDFYYIWYVFTDKMLSNAKIVYNIAKELAKVKPVLYSGKKNHFKNNSIKIGESNIYQIV